MVIAEIIQQTFYFSFSAYSPSPEKEQSFLSGRTESAYPAGTELNLFHSYKAIILSEKQQYPKAWDKIRYGF